MFLLCIYLYVHKSANITKTKPGQTFTTASILIYIRNSVGKKKRFSLPTIQSFQHVTETDKLMNNDLQDISPYLRRQVWNKSKGWKDNVCCLEQ